MSQKWNTLRNTNVASVDWDHVCIASLKQKDGMHIYIGVFPSELHQHREDEIPPYLCAEHPRTAELTLQDVQQKMHIKLQAKLLRVSVIYCIQRN